MRQPRSPQSAEIAAFEVATPLAPLAAAVASCGAADIVRGGRLSPHPEAEVTSAGLLSLALFAPSAPPGAALALQRGDELTYAGTVTERVDRPGNRYFRIHDLEVRVFVLEQKETWIDAAVLTLLRRAEDAPIAGAAPLVTGVKRDRSAAPPAVRLDLVRVHEDGTVHLLVPPGPAPVHLAADTPARALPVPPLDAFAPF